MKAKNSSVASRSKAWAEEPTARGLINRAFLRCIGFSAQTVRQPIIGICNNWSELNSCNIGLRDIASAVKRGISAAGGLPLEFHTISIHENGFDISTLVYRNLLALETEEMVVGQPFDGVVLLSGCDKTPPAQLMAAASANIPAILLPAGPALPGLLPSGPALPGWLQNKKIGCWDAARLWTEVERGEADKVILEQFEAGMNATAGTCCVLGTAGTMAAIGEAIGMSLPGSASLPAVHQQRLQLAEDTGRQIVWLAKERITPRMIMSEQALHNALCIIMAAGGSANAIIHLLAIARRLELSLHLKDFDEIGRLVPVICNVKPAGQYLLDVFHAAGGVSAVLKQIEPYLELDTLTVTGRTLRENLSSAVNRDPDVIRSVEAPVYPGEPIAVVYGNLAPAGAVIKAASATPALLQHRGRAVVFESYEHYMQFWREDEPTVSEDTVLIIRNEGPVGRGMTEIGDHIYIPKHLAAKGVQDMVRITDARMSGTAGGTIIVHVAPEAAVGGPLALVKTGDEVELSVSDRRLELLVSEAELRRRRKLLPDIKPRFRRGYRALHECHVLQASEGCDLDFMLEANALSRSSDERSEAGA